MPYVDGFERNALVVTGSRRRETNRVILHKATRVRIIDEHRKRRPDFSRLSARQMQISESG
jgi:hypothetical protein